MASFEKKPVSEQVFDVITTRINQGVWQDFLPSERWLSAELGVGRDQIHQAIIKLRGAEIIYLEGKKNRILNSSTAKSSTFSVVVMTPQSLQDASHSFLLCIDQLRKRLSRKAIPIYVETSATLTKNTADNRLEKILAKHRHAIWILHRAPPSVQQWFQSKKLPVIVLGTASDSTSLPYIDIDQAAAARHAVGVMQRAGHDLSRVLFVRPDNHLEGILRMETAYRDEMHSRNLPPCIMTYPEAYRGLELKLESLFVKGKQNIEAIITTSFRAAAFIGGWLAANHNLVIGKHLSLVCLVDGPALAHLHPPVAYYSMQGDAFASKLTRLIQKLMVGDPNPQKHNNLIIPYYIEGNSICSKPRS